MVTAVPTRTLIIESQALFAKALAQVLLLEPMMKVVGDIESISESQIRASRPDLVLIDIDSGHLDLTGAIEISKRSFPDVKICTLSMHLQPDVMQRCLAAGIDGYIVKDVTPSEFISAVKSVMSGETYVDPRIAGRLLRAGGQAARSSSNDLSVREVEVVRLIVAGMSNKQISENLHLSEKTIKNHVSRIFTKFNCTARTQAAVFALRSGIV